jgi:hypothetical protein
MPAFFILTKGSTGRDTHNQSAGPARPEEDQTKDRLAGAQVQRFPPWGLHPRLHRDTQEA